MKKEVKNLINKNCGVLIRRAHHGDFYDFPVSINGKTIIIRELISHTPSKLNWVYDFEKNLLKKAKQRLTF